MKKTIVVLSIVVITIGCSYLKSDTIRTVSTNPTNGVQTVVEKTHALGYTIIDANANLTKFSNRSGYTTNGVFGPGTYASDVNQSATSTNMANILRAVAEGVIQGMK